jgi:hypothetical protein
VGQIAKHRNVVREVRQRSSPRRDGIHPNAPWKWRAISSILPFVGRRHVVPVLAAAIAGAVLAGSAGAAPASTDLARGPTALRAVLGPVGLAVAPPLSPPASDERAEDQATAGEGVERFHEGCPFPPGVEAPEGNWNHGAYVRAWAGVPGPSAGAALSPCGKPVQSVKEGTGSPGRDDLDSGPGKGKGPSGRANPRRAPQPVRGRP